MYMYYFLLTITLYVYNHSHSHDTCNVLGDGSGCIAQQLDFGVGGDGGGERLVELAAQVEDLTYQLSTAQEELQAATQRAEQAEVSSHSCVKVILKVICRNFDVRTLKSSSFFSFF